MAVSSGGKHRFLEQERGLYAERPSVGLCFSGGGTRAMSACMGYYRALTRLGLMDDVRVTCSVSGGTWASFIYTYYRAGPADDAELLGPVTAPGDITMAGLKAPLPRTSMGWPATQSVVRALLEGFERDPLPEVWVRAIGEVMLAPFGLYDPAQPLFASLDDATVAELLARQPAGSGLGPDDFVTARPGRPFLVANACLLGPVEAGPLRTETPVVHEFTPLYVGSAQALSVTFEPKEGDPVTREVGGGYVEPFGAGGRGARADRRG